MTQNTEAPTRRREAKEHGNGEPTEQTDDMFGSEPELPKPTRDLALIAADALFQVTPQSDHLKQEIKDGDVIIIVAPHHEWVGPISEIAPTKLLGCHEPTAECRRRRGHTDDRPFRVIECDRPEERFRESLVKEVADYTAAGRTVVIVTADLDRNIPKTLQDAADHMLQLKEPATDWLARVATEATGDDQVEVSGHIKFADLRPELLKLAVRRGQSANDFVRRVAKLNTAPERADPTEKLKLDDLHGMPELVKWARGLAVDIADFKAGRLQWADMDRGVLLSGPPGVGKTLGARTVADHCGVPFFVASYSAWQATGSGHLGDVTRAIAADFEAAIKAAPSILFIDELDSIPSRASGSRHREWWRSINNTLLEKLDGAASREGVIVIGATNYPQSLDPALKRSGRLDREIEIGLPNAKALQKIFKVYLGEVLQGEDLVRLAGVSVGRTGADVAAWVRRARRTARSSARDIVFDDVLREVIGDAPERDAASTYRIAIHEAGHALVATLTDPDAPPAVMIGGTGGTAGGTIIDVPTQGVTTHKEVEQLLVLLLAGRAAEEVILGEASAGAGGPARSDLARATKIAAIAEAAYGLGSTGLMWADMENGEQFQSSMALRAGTESAVRLRLAQAYDSAKTLILAHRYVVEKLAETLVRRTVLSPEEVREITKGKLSLT